MRYLINLFPAKERNVVDKIIYFSFHYLRYILVITQFVVICVFFFRFKVDQEIVDLKDGLKQKQYIVEATQSMLSEVQNVRRKIDNTKVILDKQSHTNEMYTYFFNNFPSTLQLENLQMTENSIEVQGVTEDVDSVRIFYEALRDAKRFEEVNLTNVKKTETGYTFSLELLKFSGSNT